ncbi:MAG: efflux RND transporter periplasmic adaptor subunit [Deltaproteobacteria bacterium]
MHKGKWWLVLLAVIIGWGLWKGAAVLTEAPGKSTKPIPTVITQPVLMIDKAIARDFSGSVQAREESIISSKVSGKIVDIPVKNGDSLHAGSLLVQLDSIDYQNALQASRGNLKKAEAALTSARATYDRAKLLQASGALSQKELEDAENALKIAQGDFEMASAEVASSLTDLRDTAVTAPISGVVANRNIALGQLVSPGMALLTLEDISSVYIVINADQKQLGKLIKLGTSAEVAVEGFPNVFTGEVDTINPVANPSARVFEVKILVPNPGYGLKPGMYARAKLTSDTRQRVLAVPQNALISQEGLYYVYLCEDGKVMRREVKIGEVIGSMVEITSGLKTGQQITASNINKLKDGDVVRVLTKKRGE